MHGGAGHDGAYLTDTIQVMSFDPSNATVTLISVPRDLYVQIPPFQGRPGYWGKINEAYMVGMGSPKRGRRMSRRWPSARSALPTRPGVEDS